MCSGGARLRPGFTALGEWSSRRDIREVMRSRPIMTSSPRRLKTLLTRYTSAVEFPPLRSDIPTYLHHYPTSPHPYIPTYLHP